MYCSAGRLAPRIFYIMSVQRLIVLLTGANLRLCCLKRLIGGNVISLAS